MLGVCTKTAAPREGAQPLAQKDSSVLLLETRVQTGSANWRRSRGLRAGGAQPQPCLIGQQRLLRIEVVRHAGRDAEHEEGGEDRVGLEGQRRRELAVLHRVRGDGGEHRQLEGERPRRVLRLRVRDDRRRIVVLLRGAALAEGVELVEVPGRRVELVERPAVREGDAQRGDADGRVAEEREPRLQRDEEREVRRVEEEVVPAVQ